MILTTLLVIQILISIALIAVVLIVPVSTQLAWITTLDVWTDSAPGPLPDRSREGLGRLPRE